MKKLINDPADVVKEALLGIQAAHPDLRVDHPNKIVYRGDAPHSGKVGLISGGGSGHEPLHGGFVRLLGGTGFPMHRHRDRELTFVLSGRLYDDAGRHYAPGSVIEMAPGSAHSLRVTDEAPALLAVLSGAIEMLGE